MVLRNWLEGWFSRRSSSHTRKNRALTFRSQTNLETLEVRTLLTDPTFGYALHLGDFSTDSVSSVAPDSQGNIYVSGRFTGTVDFDPSANKTELTSTTTAPGFLAKYDAAGNLLWVNQMPSDNSQVSVAYNAALGGVSVTSTFKGTFDFDPSAADLSLVSSNRGSAYIATYAADGSVKWAKMVGGTSIMQAVAIATDDTGAVYTTGRYYVGTIDMDPDAGTSNLTNSSTPGNGNHYILKLDRHGNLVWADEFVDLKTTGDDSRPYGIAVDGSHNVYIAGYYEGLIDFDPNPIDMAVRSPGSSLDNGYLVQLNEFGGLGYVVTFENPSANEFAFDVDTDSSGNAFVTGSFGSSMNIVTPDATTNLSSSGNSTFVAKFDSLGTLTWAKAFGDSSEGFSVAYSTTGALYVGGHFSGTFDDNLPAGLALTSNGSQDNYLLQLDPSGNVTWALSWGGPSSDFLSQIAANGSGDVYTVGYFSGSQDFDPTSGTTTLTTFGNDDGFITKLTQQIIRPVVGNDSYSIPQGGTLNLAAPGILANDSTTSGNLLTAGAFKTITPLGNGTISFGDHGDIQFTPDPTFVGIFQAQYQAIDGATVSDPAYIRIYVGVNGSPNLNPAGDPVLTAIDEDVPQGSNHGTLISDIIASMAPKGGITDPDSGALQGLAIIGANQAAGTWQYSLNNGTDWSDFGTTSNASALLLASNANTRVRFLPKKDYNGSSAFCCIAWDQTDGNSNGAKVAIAAAGGTTAFSTTREYPTITINSVNDAPVLTRVGMPQLDDINEDQTDATNPGTLVSDILSRAALSGGKIKDVDTGALTGIAVIGANQNSGNWQFTTDGGLNWQNFTTTSVGNALVLATNANTRVRFQPKKDFQGDAQFTYIAWDQSDASVNGTHHAITGGGSNPCSSGRQNAQLVIHPVNDAPILNNKGNPYIDPFSHSASSSQIHGNDIPTLVSRITQTGGSITDVDGQTNSGIAVIGIGGIWEFSSDDGDTWTQIEPVSVNHALLLGWDISTRIRLKQPGAAGVYGFTFVAWDTSSELALTYVNITAAGGTTPFSTARETATVTVS